MKEFESYMEAASKCTRCGNCQYYCPTFNVTRVESYTARGRLELVKSNKSSLQGRYSKTFIKRMNQCLLCGNCSNICPSGIKTESIIEAVRTECAMASGVPAALGYARENISKAGSITGENPEDRLLWLKNIEDKIAGIKIFQHAEYAYFTGCVPALYPSSYSIPQSFVTALIKAGVDFTLVGDTESCCGYPLVIGGLPGEAERTAQKNVETLKKLGAKKIITTCPSCYHMWSEYYPQLLGYKPDFDLIHGTQLLEKLACGGVFNLKELKRAVTYHDPCDLGRKSGIYDAPRNVLNCIPGIQLREMKHSREDSRCCGGGGNLEMNDPVLQGKVARERVQQALDTGAETIVTACQQCKRTLIGGARQMKARIKVMDISELLAMAIM